MVPQQGKIIASGGINGNSGGLEARRVSEGVFALPSLTRRASKLAPLKLESLFPFTGGWKLMYRKVVVSLVMLAFVVSVLGCSPPASTPKPNPPSKGGSNTTTP